MLQRDPHGFRKDVKEFITMIKSFQVDIRTETILHRLINMYFFWSLSITHIQK